MKCVCQLSTQSEILRKGKEFKTATNINLSGNSRSENNPAMSNHEDDVNSETEAYIQNQEDVNEG